MPDGLVQPLKESGKADSQALKPLGARKNKVPPRMTVPAANHKPVIQAPRDGRDGSGAASGTVSGCDSGDRLRSSTRSSPWLMAQVKARPSRPAQREGPESNASPVKKPAQATWRFSHRPQANSTKVSARIPLPAWRERATKPGSTASKKE